MPIYNASEIKTPSGTAPTTASVAAAVSAAGGNGTTTLGALYKPMKDVWPAVDATNGPLTGYALGTGTPSTASRTSYPWNTAGKFNQQSQNWGAVPTGAGQNDSGVSACANFSTPRFWTYGNMNGMAYESNMDFSFVTDATDLVISYYHYNLYTSSNYHDIQVYAEYNGHMRKMTAMPLTSTAGGGAYNLTISFKEARSRRVRVMLPHNCWFRGILTNTSAVVTAAPNLPLIATNGDSWNEPAGNVLAAPIGGAYPTGTYRNAGLSQMIAEATGFAVILMAEGGTGEFNCNDATSRAATYTDSVGTSVFHGVTRINDAWTKFGAKKPIIWTIGGWNDGSLGVNQATYQAAVNAGIARWRAKDSGIKLLYTTIQPVDLVGGDVRSLSILGQVAACAANPDVVIGCINESSMWTTQTNDAGTQRNAAVNQADTIHLHAKGAEGVANWFCAKAASLPISLAYINAQLAVAV